MYIQRKYVNIDCEKNEYKNYRQSDKQSIIHGPILIFKIRKSELLYFLDLKYNHLFAKTLTDLKYELVYNMQSSIES